MLEWIGVRAVLLSCNVVFRRGGEAQGRLLLAHWTVTSVDLAGLPVLHSEPNEHPRGKDMTMIITAPDTAEDDGETRETSNPGSEHTDNDDCQPWDGTRE